MYSTQYLHLVAAPIGSRWQLLAAIGSYKLNACFRRPQVLACATRIQVIYGDVCARVAAPATATATAQPRASAAAAAGASGTLAQPAPAAAAAAADVVADLLLQLLQELQWLLVFVTSQTGRAGGARAHLLARPVRLIHDT